MEDLMLLEMHAGPLFHFEIGKDLLKCYFSLS